MSKTVRNLQLVRRISELLEAIEQRLRASSVPPVSKGSGVFQIACDEILLITRAELLKNRGYEVGSALGNDEAKRILDKGRPYHRFIVGHAAPKKTREDIVRWLKANFPDTKILALNPPHYTKLAKQITISSSTDLRIGFRSLQPLQPSLSFLPHTSIRQSYKKGGVQFSVPPEMLLC